jgi:DNA-binding NarL/FixJ family response regulator
MLPGVERVADAESVREAWEHPDLFASELVILEHSVEGGSEFIGAVTEATSRRVIVCSADANEDAVLGALRAGATGFLRKDSLTPDALSAAVQAAAGGAGVLAPDLLGSLLRGVASEGSDGRPSLARLTEREQQVLALIAKGHPTREVALELSYSERTVKNVLHDVVTKLNARSRSQAVAHAVREGLI